jgi:glycine/D-amino acid oxidase-like deaminating enzyme
MGSTIASTAMIQFEIDQPLTGLAKKIGRAKAARVYQRSFQAVKDLKALIKKHDLRADWVDRDAVYLAGNSLGHRALEQEARAREKIGLPSTYLGAAAVKETYGFDRTGAIISAGAAELDPIRTCIACLKAARDLGAKIYSPVSVTASEQDGDDIRVTTRDGPDIICRNLVMATGYEVSPAIPKGSFDIVSSWAIATQPIKPQRFWRDRCLVWEASDPYLYMRATADNRIVIGGEDADVSAPSRRAAAIPAKSKKLLEKAKELTGLDELECDYSWAGAFAEHPKGLPVFKPLDDVKGGYAILGCGGNGITFSVIGAQIIRDWIGGKSDPDASLFRG